MIIDELFDEDSFDPKKLFDENEYSTLIIKREGFSRQQNTAADLIEGLLEPNITRAESEEIFAALKKNNAADLLVASIRQAEGENQKKVLTAACWESGLDFTGHFLFFADLVCDSGLGLAMEAFTVIEEMENEPPAEEVAKVLAKIRAQKEPANAMVTELLTFLKDKTQ